MKKKKIPKYIQDKFSKPQFALGDTVKYNFLGKAGWGIITNIYKHYDTISYMVKGNDRTYPCGLTFKEHRSYYAGTIFFEESDNYRKHSKDSRGPKTKSGNNSGDSKRILNHNGNGVSKKSRRSSKKHDTGNSTSKNSARSAESRTGIDTAELNDAIAKQKEFLRKFN